MKCWYMRKFALALVALWSLAETAMATTTCKYLRPAVHGSFPLLASAITVGRDVSLGTVVYRQKFEVEDDQYPHIECQSTVAPFEMHTLIDVGPSSKKANWSQGPYANKVYLTNIKGLGIVLASESLPPYPYRAMYLSNWKGGCNSPGRCGIYLNTGMKFELLLIKIGDVEPGLLHEMPTLNYTVTIDGVSHRGLRMSPSGSMQIVSRTCSTPDVTVPMGSHLTNKFTKLGSSSEWKDFSIALNNCPAFHGTYSSNPSIWLSEGGLLPSGKPTGGAPDSNSLGFRIDPVRTAILPNEGVLSLDPVGVGSAPAANGIGVQIASSNGSVVPLGRVQRSGLSLRNSIGSYIISLKARYLQTGNMVSPGPANASARFTIIYQ